MLKAYKCDDSDLYAANDVEEAKRLWHEMVGDGEEMDDEYPQELTDEELDKRYPAYYEDERPIEGETISVREMLLEHIEAPGWIAGSGW